MTRARPRPGEHEKFGQDAFGDRVWRIVRDAIEEETARRRTAEGGWCGARAAIADAIGVPRTSMEKWLTPSDRLMPPLAAVMQLLSREDVLCREVREAVVADLCREWGFEPPAGLVSGREDRDLVRAQIEASAAAGRFAEAVGRATDPDSDEGPRISDGERERLRRAAEGLSRAAQAGRAALARGTE